MSEKQATGRAGTGDGWSLGIDIGGTFTDVVLRNDRTGQIVAHKESTSAGDASVGAGNGVARLLAMSGITGPEITRVVHATTLFTNALIERRGVAAGLITTTGFRDVLEIGNERKFDLYDLTARPPVPLIPRHRRLEVAERTDAGGTVRQGIDRGALLEQAAALLDLGAESLAVGFVNAHANPANEAEALEILRAARPGIYVTASHEVSQTIGEFERLSTVAANAYVGPIAAIYLDELEAVLRGLGISASLFLMQSNGGLASLAEARRRPITLLESGPAAGVIAAARFGSLFDETNLLAFDMGGTTAKLAAVTDSKPMITHRFEAAREKRFTAGSGLPLLISTVDLIEIGAGGGSISATNDLGLIAVGPQSAGSEPGPACYDRGGSNPTVTDANLELGYLNADYFAGGTVEIRPDLARGALERLVVDLEMPADRAARGIREIVAETMAAAARRYISERGVDVRCWALLVTGGGGPLHGCDVAAKIGVRRVICPPNAGVASAIGLIIAPARVDRVQSLGSRLDLTDWDIVESRFAAMETDARAVLAETAPGVQGHARRSADMRYAGQGFEVTVDLPDGPYDASAEHEVLAAFEKRYAQSFGRVVPDGRPELVNIRILVEAVVDTASVPRIEDFDREADRPEASRNILVGTGETVATARILHKTALRPGAPVTGPAMIEEDSSSLFVPVDATATLQSDGSIVIDLPVTPLS